MTTARGGLQMRGVPLHPARLRFLPHLRDAQAVSDTADRTAKRPWTIRIGRQPAFGMTALWDVSIYED